MEDEETPPKELSGAEETLQEETPKDLSTDENRESVIVIKDVHKSLAQTVLKGTFSRFAAVKQSYFRDSRFMSTYYDAWIQFNTKKEAKDAARAFNEKPIKFGQGLWHVKYLRGFEWADLLESFHLTVEKSRREERKTKRTVDETYTRLMSKHSEQQTKKSKRKVKEKGKKKGKEKGEENEKRVSKNQK
eukprot:Trichotokara_eunicae@DN5226_c0_g1_i3.p1